MSIQPASRQLEITISETLDQWLSREAQRRDQNVSSVIQAVLEQYAQPFDLTKTRTWELCGAFTVAEPEPEYIVGGHAQQPDATSEQATQERHSPESQYPLRGTVVHYDDPFTPVAQSDWEALR
jgi:hypothetical protein